MYLDYPKVLVIMSTYNGDKYVAEKIESIIEQKNIDIYLKIYDDCSSDNTINISLQSSKLYGYRKTNVIFFCTNSCK